MISYNEASAGMIMKDRLAKLQLENETLAHQVKQLVKAESKLYEYQEKLDAQLKEYQNLYDLNKRLNSASDIGTLFEHAVAYAINNLEYEKVLVFQRCEKVAGYAVCVLDGYYGHEEKGSVASLALSWQDPLFSLLEGAEYLIDRGSTPDKHLTRLAAQMLMDEYLLYPLGSGPRPFALLAVGNSAGNAEFYRRISDAEEALLGVGNLVGLLSSSLENRISYDQMERALEQERRAEAKYRGIFENAAEGILQTAADGRFISCNPAAAVILGYDTPEEVLEDVPGSAKPDASPPRRQELYELIRAGTEIKDFEVEFYRKDGSKRWLLVSTRPSFNKDDEIIHVDGTIQDITERKRAEEALRFTKFAIDRTIDQAFWMTEDARFFYVNQAACRTLGYTSEELTQMSVPDIGPTFPPEAFAAHWRELQKNGSATFESYHRAKDGRVYPVEIRANYVVFDGKEYNCAFATDITERRKAEEALKNSHAELEQRVKERTFELSKANQQLRQKHLETSALYTVSAVISRSIQMDNLLHDVLNTISQLEVFNTDKGGIFVIDGDRMKLAAHLDHSADFLKAHDEMKVGECLCGLAAECGEIVVSTNSHTDQRHTIRYPGMAPHGHVIVPLKTKGKVIGVLYLYMPADLDLDEDKSRLLALIGNQLGIAIENARIYEETKTLSQQDPLTGLWNHEEILRILEQELLMAEPEQLPVGVIMADVDHFKEVNDTFGHLAGDEVLRRAAGRMLSMTRSYDAVGRYGGEEFLIVLPGCNATGAAEIAERVRKSLAAKGMETPEGLIAVTISLGVAASSTGKRMNVRSLIRLADSALYRAKEKGRNRVEVAADSPSPDPPPAS